MMEPLTTARLVLRPMRMADAPALAEWRSDPTTAHHQSWKVPYTLAQAEQLITDVMKLDGPTDGEWYQLAITDSATDEVVGDVVCHLSCGGRTAEIGYSLAAAHRGRGYATEAAHRLITHLFDDLGVHRVEAALHPDNWDSAMVLERLGFVHEGTARQAYWVGDDCTDDAHYGMLRADWVAWNDRPRLRPQVVELAEITPANVDDVYRLAVHRSQQRFVASVPGSFADALIPDVDDGGGALVPWFRAILADGEPAGFVMMAEPTATNPDPYLWRLLIDRRHQRRGIGTMVLDLLAERYRAQGHRRLVTSYVPAHGGPAAVYHRYGFVDTGEIDDDELVSALML